MRGPRECWPWTGVKTSDGYGQIRVGSRMKYAHHVAYEFAFGSIPSGLHVLHRCDLRCCVNPNHLVLGTHKENMMDAALKGRNAFGECHHAAKLNWHKVDDIRERYAEGRLSETKLAKEFGVTRSTISQILCDKTWRQRPEQIMVPLLILFANRRELQRFIRRLKSTNG
jgi:hypothetical protein